MFNPILKDLGLWSVGSILSLSLAGAYEKLDPFSFSFTWPPWHPHAMPVSVFTLVNLEVRVVSPHQGTGNHICSPHIKEDHASKNSDKDKLILTSLNSNCSAILPFNYSIFHHECIISSKKIKSLLQHHKCISLFQWNYNITIVILKYSLYLTDEMSIVPVLSLTLWNCFQPVPC